MRHGLTFIELNRAFSATLGNVLFPGALPQAASECRAFGANSDTIKDRLILSFGGSHQSARIRLYYRGNAYLLLSVQEILERIFIPRKTTKQEGNTTMKKLLLIALMAGGLAFVPAQRSEAQVSVGVGFGYPAYRYGYYNSYPYGYGYYRPYRYYGYSTGPSYYYGHRYNRHHRYHHYYRY
jgi:hypothetical protein